MTSKISSFKIAIEDIRHRVWMLALSCLGSFLALPVSFLLCNRDYLSSASYYENYGLLGEHLYHDYTNFIFRHSVLLQAVVLFAGAFIVGICSFRHLYSRRMADLYHALPVKRERFFLIYWLDGVLIYLVPLLIGNLLTLGIMLVNLAHTGSTAYFGSLLASSLLQIGILLTAYLTVYHFCLVCVGFSGNAFNALCSICLLGSSAAALYAFVYELCDSFFRHFMDLPLTLWDIAWASPLVSAFLTVSIPDSAADYFIAGDFVPDQGKLLFLFVSVTLVWIVNLLLALLLYVKRPSELAERGVRSPLIQHPARILAAVLGGLSGAFIFYGMLDRDAVGWHLFGLILGGVFAFGVMDIILNMNFRAFFSHKWEMLATLLVSCLLFLSFSYDWFGYDTRIPDKEDIVSASFRFTGYGDSSYSLTLDPDSMTVNSTSSSAYRFGSSPDMEYTDTDAIYALLSAIAPQKSIPGGTHFSTGCYADIRLRGGRMFRRYYQVSEYELELVRPILESDAYRSTYYRASSGLLGAPDTISIEDSLLNIVYTNTDSEQIRLISEAYRQDLLEHYCLEKLENGLVVGNLSMHYGRNVVDLDVYEDYTHTIAALRDAVPGIAFSLEDLSIKQINAGVEPPYLNTMRLPVSREFYGSYFGLDGYPDYADFIAGKEALDTPEASGTADGSPESALPEEVKPTATREFDGSFPILTLTEKEDFEALAPFLHPCGRRVTSPLFSESQREYVCFGEIQTTSNQYVTCYVKKGELPEEWIDRILNAPARDWR